MYGREMAHLKQHVKGFFVPSYRSFEAFERFFFKTMRSFLHNSFVIVVVWNFLSVSCRPQGSLFSIDSFNNDPFTSPSNDINFFVSDEELDNLSTDVAANPTKLNFNSDLTPIVSDSDVGTEPDLPIIISDDLFSTTAIGEEYALDSNSLLCEMTDNKLINDDNAVVQQLQIRDGAASSSSCPANQPTAGQSTKPSGGIDDEGQFKFDEFLRSRPKIPTLFKEVFQICPPEPFGLSNIPVCDNPEFQSLAIPQPGQDWVTLHDVLACKLFSFFFVLLLWI